VVSQIDPAGAFTMATAFFVRTVAVMFAAVVASASADAGLRAGAAKIEITPPMGVSLDGSISKNGPATSVHDPLHARALVLESDGSRIAIVVVDQCMTAAEVFDAAKRKVNSETGVPVQQMLMAATHTHAAPRTIHIGRSQLDDQYHEYLSARIAAAVLQAFQNLAPAQIGYAAFDRPELVACRRFLCAHGSVGINPFGDSGERIKSVAGSSSQVIGPAGPIDPQFSVLSVRHVDGTPLCLLGNFSVHYCGGYQRGAVSADYFGYFSSAVEAALATETDHPDVVGIMSNGTSGDTGAFQRGSPEKFEPFEGMQFYGRMLAEQAIGAAAAAGHRSDVSVEMIESEIEFDLRRPHKQRQRWADQVLANPKDKQPHRWTKIYANETRHLTEYSASEVFKLQAIRIGDIAVAAAPCEVFAETGLAIKKESPIKHTFNMELANGYGGYLPTREQHELGGYETWAARSSKLEVGAEETIRAELLRLLNSLAP
jgi:neutral ceramidase